MAFQDSSRVYVIAIFLFSTLLFSSITNTNYESFAISNDHEIETNFVKDVKKISVDHSISLSETMGLSSPEEKKDFNSIIVDDQKTVKSIIFEEGLIFSSDFSQHESSIILVKQNSDRKGMMERIIINDRFRSQEKENKNYFDNTFELINIDSSLQSNNNENPINYLTNPFLNENFISNNFEYNSINMSIYHLQLDSFVDSIFQIKLTNNLTESDHYNGLIFLGLISSIILIRSENNNIKFYSFRKFFSYVFIMILLSSGIFSPASISSSYWGSAFAEEMGNTNSSSNVEFDLSNTIINSNDISNSSSSNIEEIIDKNLINSLVENNTEPIIENYTVPISNQTEPIIENYTVPISNQTEPIIENYTVPISNQTEPIIENYTVPISNQTEPIIENYTVPISNQTEPIIENYTVPISNQTEPIIENYTVPISNQTEPIIENYTVPISNQTEPIIENYTVPISNQTEPIIENYTVPISNQTEPIIENYTVPISNQTEPIIENYTVPISNQTEPIIENYTVPISNQTEPIIENYTVPIVIPNATESWEFESQINGSQFVGNVHIEKDVGLVLNGDGYVTNDGNSTGNLSNLTITAWVKPYYANGSAELTVISKEKTFELIINNVVDPKRVAKFSIFDGIKQHTIISSGTFGENWSHIAVTFNGTLLSMYTNGTLSNELIVSDTIVLTTDGKLEPRIPKLVTSSSNVVVGAILDNARSIDKVSKKFSGEIYDIEIYDTYLSAAQIAEIYKRSFPTVYKVTNSIDNDPIQNNTSKNIPLEDIETINVLGNINTIEIDNSTDIENLSNYTEQDIAIELNGTEDYITITENNLNDQINQLTISAFIEPDYTSGSAEFTIISKEKSFALSLNNIISPQHVPKFSVFDGISWIDITGKTKIEKWSNLVAVIDGNRISLYLNSILIGNTKLPEPIYVSEDKLLLKKSDVMVTDSDLVLGAYINSHRGESKLSNYFSGVIDDVHIYKEALDEKQIQEIYLKFLKKLEHLKDTDDCEDDDNKNAKDDECDDDRDDCEDLIHSKGYWKNHPDHLAIILEEGQIYLGDTTVETVAEAVKVLKNASAKDARDSLRAHLLATILNLRNGGDPIITGEDINEIVNSAILFLETHPEPVKSDHLDRKKALMLKNKLDDYNKKDDFNCQATNHEIKLSEKLKFQDSLKINFTNAQCRVIVDFSSLSHGSDLVVINNYLESFDSRFNDDIKLSMEPRGKTLKNEVRIYDTNPPIGADPDLEVNIGNIVILPDKIGSPPQFKKLSDSPDGGKQFYDFNPPRDLDSFIFVDHDNNIAKATTYDVNGNMIKSVVIPIAGDKSVQTIKMDSPDTSRLIIDYHDSGGVTQLILSCISKNFAIEFDEELELNDISLNTGNSFSIDLVESLQIQDTSLTTQINGMIHIDLSEKLQFQDKAQANDMLHINLSEKLQIQDTSLTTQINGMIHIDLSEKLQFQDKAQANDMLHINLSEKLQIQDTSLTTQINGMIHIDLSEKLQFQDKAQANDMLHINLSEKLQIQDTSLTTQINGMIHIDLSEKLQFQDKAQANDMLHINLSEKLQFQDTSLTTQINGMIHIDLSEKLQFQDKAQANDMLHINLSEKLQIQDTSLTTQINGMIHIDLSEKLQFQDKAQANDMLHINLSEKLQFQDTSLTTQINGMIHIDLSEKLQFQDKAQANDMLHINLSEKLQIQDTSLTTQINGMIHINLLENLQFVETDFTQKQTFQITLPETLTFNDDTAQRQTFEITLPETLTFNDDTAQRQTFEITLPETLTFNDDTAQRQTFEITLPETLTFNDDTAQRQTFEITLPETLTFNDDTAQRQTFEITLPETLTFNDDTAQRQTFEITLPETLTFNDDTAQRQTFEITLPETLTFNDDTAQRQTFEITLPETLTFNDDTAQRQTFEITLPETLTFNDDTAQRQTFEITLPETLTFNDDTAQRQTFEITLPETLTFNDDTAQRQTFEITLPETLTFNDDTAQRQTFEITLPETLFLDDDTAQRQTFEITLPETLTFNDDTAQRQTFEITLPETLNIIHKSNTFIVNGIILLGLEENLQFQDSEVNLEKITHVSLDEKLKLQESDLDVKVQFKIQLDETLDLKDTTIVIVRNNGQIQLFIDETFDLNDEVRFNAPPNAFDDTGTTDEDTPLNVLAPGVLGNDIDPDVIDTKTVTQVNGISSNVGIQITLTSGALLTINSDGSYTYDPNGKFENLGVGTSAIDSFTYTMSDSAGETDSATVTITITGVNDTPAANSQKVSTLQNVPKTITLTGFDIDGDPLTFSIASGSSFGILSGIKSPGPTSAKVTYTPNSGFIGTDTFSFTVTDGNGGSSTAIITVNVTPLGSGLPPGGGGAGGGGGGGGGGSGSSPTTPKTPSTIGFGGILGPLNTGFGKAKFNIFGSGGGCFVDANQTLTVSGSIDNSSPLNRIEMRFVHEGDRFESYTSILMNITSISDGETSYNVSGTIPWEFMSNSNGIRYWIHVIDENSDVSESDKYLMSVRPGYSLLENELGVVIIQVEGTTLNTLVYVDNTISEKALGVISLTVDGKVVDTIEQNFDYSESIVSLTWKIPKVGQIMDYQIKAIGQFCQKQFETEEITLATFPRVIVKTIPGLIDIESFVDKLGNTIASAFSLHAFDTNNSTSFRVEAPNGSCVIGIADECLINKATFGTTRNIESITIDNQIYRIRYSGSDNVMERFTITSIDPIIGKWGIYKESSDGKLQTTDTDLLKIHYVAQESKTPRDSDGDGISDFDEVTKYNLDPFNADTDNDGLTDGLEIELGTDPRDRDTDNGGVDDGTEVLIDRTDPTLGTDDKIDKQYCDFFCFYWILLVLIVGSIVTIIYMKYYKKEQEIFFQ